MLVKADLSRAVVGVSLEERHSTTIVGVDADDPFAAAVSGESRRGTREGGNPVDIELLLSFLDLDAASRRRRGREGSGYGRGEEDEERARGFWREFEAE